MPSESSTVDCYGWCTDHDEAAGCTTQLGSLNSTDTDIDLVGTKGKGQWICIGGSSLLDPLLAGVLSLVIQGNTAKIAMVCEAHSGAEWEHVAWCQQQHGPQDLCDADLLHTEGNTQILLAHNNYYEDPPIVLQATGVPQVIGEPDDLCLCLGEIGEAYNLLQVGIRLMHAEYTGQAGVLNRRDRLKIGLKVPLGAGEQVIASDRFEGSDDYLPNEVALAALTTPAGPQLRLAIIHYEARRRWRTERVDPDDTCMMWRTVLLDGSGITQLVNGLAAVHASAGRYRLRLAELLEQMEQIPDGEWAKSTAFLPKWEPGSMSAAEWHEFTKQSFRFTDNITPAQRDVLYALHDLEGMPQEEGILAAGPWGDLIYQIIPDEECTSDAATVEIQIGIRHAEAAADWTFDDVTRYEDELRLHEGDLPKLGKKILAMTTG